MSRSVPVPDIGLDYLLQRTELAAEGECLEWQLRAVHGRYPTASIEGKRWYIRRLLWRITRGRSAPSCFDVCVSCGNPLCVHPDHLALRRPPQRTGGVPKSLEHRVKTALAMRARSSLTEEDVREIRASESSNAELDTRFGRFVGYALRVRTGRLRRDLSSPFAGLGAR